MERERNFGQRMVWILNTLSPVLIALMLALGLASTGPAMVRTVSLVLVPFVILYVFVRRASQSMEIEVDQALNGLREAMREQSVRLARLEYQRDLDRKRLGAVEKAVKTMAPEFKRLSKKKKRRAK